MGKGDMADCGGPQLPSRAIYTREWIRVRLRTHIPAEHYSVQLMSPLKALGGSAATCNKYSTAPQVGTRATLTAHVDRLV